MPIQTYFAYLVSLFDLEQPEKSFELLLRNWFLQEEIWLLVLLQKHVDCGLVLLRKEADHWSYNLL